MDKMKKFKEDLAKKIIKANQDLDKLEYKFKVK
jgi:hypothetical protein